MDCQEYRERVVGFVDILGFGDLVRRADCDDRLRADIVSALRIVRSVKPPIPGDTDLRVQNFSDSLIISARDTPDGLWHLLMAIDAVANQLLQMGVLIRGGVAVGGMLHTDELAFGVGVNEAYRMESTVAKVPRITLSATAIQRAISYADHDDVAQTYLAARLLRDSDGVWFLHYLATLGIFNQQAEVSSDRTRHPLFKAGVAIRNEIQGKIEETLDQPEIYAKLKWFALYWNKEVADHALAGNPSLIPHIVLPGTGPSPMRLPFQAH